MSLSMPTKNPSIVSKAVNCILLLWFFWVFFFILRLNVTGFNKYSQLLIFSINYHWINVLLLYFWICELWEYTYIAYNLTVLTGSQRHGLIFGRVIQFQITWRTPRANVDRVGWSPIAKFPFYNFLCDSNLCVLLL